MSLAPACYREFAPCGELRDYVTEFFTFSVPGELVGTHGARRAMTREIRVGGSGRLGSPLLADGHQSIVFSFGPAYCVQGLWSPGESGPSGHVIGAMSAARTASHGERIIQVGAYVRPAQARALLCVPPTELTDQIVALDDLWGGDAVGLEAQIAEARSDGERVAALERALVERVAHRRALQSGPDVAGMASFVLSRSGLLTVNELAFAAGVSRQYLARSFKEEIGVAPKLYCRLARFRAALNRANIRSTCGWATVAADLGYADQSHLIADFKEFAGLTPGTMMAEKRFHPFVEQRA
jgi:AraC-like DNA-binding protein